MIIKRARTPKRQESTDTTEAQKPVVEQKPVKKEPELEWTEDGPRPERRRGDRRRGYRRIDDRNLISRAQEEANAIKEMSASEGFEYGLEQSKNQLKEFNNVLQELFDAKEKAIAMATSDIAEMAIAVAEKIIQKELETDPNIVLNIITEVLKEMGKNQKSITIRVNSADIDLVKEHIPEIYPYSGANEVTIVAVADGSVEWGSCIVETDTGLVDARFSTQLSVLKKAFEAGT